MEFHLGIGHACCCNLDAACGHMQRVVAHNVEGIVHVDERIAADLDEITFVGRSRVVVAEDGECILVDDYIGLVVDGEILQSVQLSLGGIDGAAGHVTRGNRVIEPEFMHVVAKRVGDDRSRRDGQDVAAVGGDVLVEVHRHIVAVGPHGGLVGGAGGGVGQGGLAARGNAIHQLGEGDDEIAQTLHVALGGIDRDLIIERLAVIGDRVIEVQFAHGLVHGVEDDRTGGNLQGVFSGLVDLVREVDQHVEAHIIHFGLVGRARRVVGENGLAAVVDFAHILRERDGKILQALHVALGRVDGDLIVERLQIALDAEPECQGQEPLSVDLERAFGQVQEIVT